MARYWVGGGATANWNATGNTNWGTASGTQDNASVPGSADDVIFDSHANGNTPCTLSAATTINSLVFNGGTGWANTLTHDTGATLTIDSQDGSGNSLLMVAGMTYTPAALGSRIIFTGAGTSKITTGGQSLSKIQFNNAGDTFQLQDNLTLIGTNGITASSSIFVLTAGTFDPNGKTVTFTGATPRIDGAPTFFNLTRTGNNVKTDVLTLAGNITVTNNFTATGNSIVNRLTVLSEIIGTPRTITVTSATISGCANVDFMDITFIRNGAIDDVADDGGGNARFRTTAVHGYVAGNKVTVAGMGRAEYNALLTISNVSDTTHFDVAIAYTADADEAGTYGGVDLSAISGLSGDCGGNTISGAGTLIFTTAAAQTWATADGGNWSGANWGAGRVPLPQDDVAMGMAYSGASKNVVADMPRLGKSIDWTGATGTPRWTLDGNSNTSYGNLTLISTMNFTHSSCAYHLAGRAAYNLTTATIQFYNIYIDAPTGTYTLGGTISLAFRLSVTAGNFITAGYSITTQYGFSSTGTITRSVDITNSTITITNLLGWEVADTGLTSLTTTGSTISYTKTGAAISTFIGGNQTYNNITMVANTGTLTFSGAFTFANMTMSSAGTKTVKFTKSTIYTCTGTFVSGSATGDITLDTADGAGTFQLTKSGGGTVSCDYLNISRSVGDPGTTWYAGTHSHDTASNSGWVFTDPPSGATLRELALLGVGL